VGKVTTRALRAHGIETIAQLRRRTPQELQAIIGHAAEELLSLAHGEDDRQVEPDRERKSLSSERTFATDVSDAFVLSSVLLSEVEEVAQRLRRRRLKAKTVTLKLRYGDFRTITRSETLSEATHVTQSLWQATERVFHSWHAHGAGPLRLLGFAASGLEAERAGQQLLFADPQEEKLKSLDEAVDKIRGRYGNKAVRRGGSKPP
jgi:DNA polymerase-4